MSIPYREQIVNRLATAILVIENYSEDTTGEPGIGSGKLEYER